MTQLPTPETLPPSSATPTLGVFDSGVGGLTVLRALGDHLPHARFIYLGDTARLPYGSKSRSTVVRYAVSASRFLIDQGADRLVIACNTASALALADIRSAVAPVPVLGVIAPGAAAARAHADASPHPAKEVLVLATAATVSSHAYRIALEELGLTATEKPCPLFVPLVEEGWTDHPVTADVARIYLREALAEAPGAHTLLLGCTHYPLLRPLLERTLRELRHPMHLVDSAVATTQAVQTSLSAPGASVIAAPPSIAPPACPPQAEAPELVVYATDSVDRFQHLGSRFLGRPLPPVQLIDLGG